MLPRGWLLELRARYEKGPEGFVAIDRDLPEDFRAPKVRLSQSRFARLLPADGMGHRPSGGALGGGEAK
jgi:hypothetical protein